MSTEQEEEKPQEGLYDRGIVVNLHAGSLMYRGLPNAGRLMTGVLDRDGWDPSDGWTLADLCHLRVLLLRNLRKIEDHLDSVDIQLTRRATLRKTGQDIG